MEIKLTQREEEVLLGIAKGFTSKEIARELYLSDSTVITYRKQLLSKLKAINSASLIYKAAKYGYLELGT